MIFYVNDIIQVVLIKIYFIKLELCGEYIDVLLEFYVRKDLVLVVGGVMARLLGFGFCFGQGIVIFGDSYLRQFCEFVLLISFAVSLRCFFLNKRF